MKRVLLTAMAFLLIACATAQASQVESFEVTSSTSQAGGHPDLEMAFALGDPGPVEGPKDIVLRLPQGLFGNPNAVDRCGSLDFALDQCPLTSQLGTVTVRADYEGNQDVLLGTAPIFDMETRTSGETARVAFIAPTADVPVIVPISVRTSGDYGLTLKVAAIPQAISVTSARFNIWGFPAATDHDGVRFVKGSPGSPTGCPGEASAECAGGSSNPHSSGLLIRPLIDNPTVCNGQPLPVSLEVASYGGGAPAHAATEYPPATGCEEESFHPVFNAALTTDRADSAAGLEIQLKASQFLGFANAPSAIRSGVLTLPPGVSINPDAADGQSACTESQANFDSEQPAECPDNSKIGTFEIGTPALDGPLVGSIYIGDPKPDDQYRVFMIASGFGINAKLVASIEPDPKTGQLTLRATDLPQVPFERFDMNLFASDRGLIATPTQCTLYTADSVITPWNDQLPPQNSRPNLSIAQGPIGRPCPGQIRPFAPRLVAGMPNPVGGAFSTFHLKLDRDDGDQFLSDLSFRLPPGFTGDLRGLSYCPQAAIAISTRKTGLNEQSNPSCPASSQIGTTNVAAGPGSHPFHAVGKMYLAGPLQGAPLSLVAITPALAGPYDYGTVVIRVALHVDQQTAQVRAVSETMPQIIGGVPIRMRSIQVNIDRPNFTINPTNCSPSSIDSVGIGDQGTVTNFSSYFHAVNCRALPFRPSMAIAQTGDKKNTHRTANPKLVFDLRTRPGDANIKSLSVTLSSAFAIDQRHLGNICSERELADKQCAGRTPIGKATTTTPLLDQPLTGPVFAVSGSGGLPKLAFILNGQINLVPRAETKTITKNGAGKLQTTVPVIPDAPVGHFALTIFGGKAGYLVNTRDLCAKVPVAKVAYTGQNNKVYSQSVKIKAPCGKSKSRHKRGNRK